MTKINYALIDPGGNSTVLVLNRIKRSLQKYLARKIMTGNKLKCEQVGFIESARSKRALLRLQMMGGELCANALRATAVWLAQANKSIKTVKNYRVETSGTTQLISITVRTDDRGNAQWAETEIPLTGSIEPKQISLDLDGKSIPARMIRLEGITHVLVPKRFFRKGLDFRQTFARMYENYQIKNEAIGIIFYKKKSRSRFAIKPVVYVRKTDTIAFETSCASGTVGLAIVQGILSGTQKIYVRQPSGFDLIVRVETSRRKKRIFVGGGIRSISTGSIMV
jgi:diaminopimelate epimerase